MPTSTRPVWAEVNLDHISYNVRSIRRLLPNARFMAVVKADGYGHGAARVARTAVEAGADWLGVAIPEEGESLREAGFTQPILVLGACDADQAPLVAKWGLQAVVPHEPTSQALSRTAADLGVTISVHMKIDTGMGRLGILPEEAVAFARFIQSLPGLELAGILTHFATADENDVTYFHLQLRRFEGALAALAAAGVPTGIRHAANSAAAIDFPEAAYDMVRIGLAMYGVPPSERSATRVELKPALRLLARLSSVKRLPSGHGVSYGKSWVTWRTTAIATLPIGYADGYSRLLSNRAEVIVGGRRVPIAGRICMDQCMINVEGLDVSVGDEAVLLGRQVGLEVSAEELAAHMGTIPYEVLTSIGPRVPRVYVGGLPKA